MQAQQQQGRIVYDFYPPMHVSLRGTNSTEDLRRALPRNETVKVEVLFGNNQMIRRVLDEAPLNEMAGNENGMHIRTMGPGADDIIWLNFTEARKVEQREFAAKQYLISDSLQPLQWKLTGKTRTILGYVCQEATAERIGKRTTMNFENGKMTRKEETDTSIVDAWFTTAIPVPAGPDFQGQLPGLILQVDMEKNPYYKAIEVSPKVDTNVIKEPRKGKKVTLEAFNQEREKMMQEMERNGGGRMRLRG
jgi:GLPGLI family protein